MLKKWENGTVKDVPKDGYLEIDGTKHLILNIKNQPIEVLNSNNIYEFIENAPIEQKEGYYYTDTYTLTGNVIHKVYEEHKLEEVEEYEQ
jgi:hypothetical protein